MINQGFINELTNEFKATRKLLERVPQESLGWKPHEKSMSLQRLSGHVAELLRFIPSILKYDELDFSKGGYVPFNPETTEQLVAFFDEQKEKVFESLQASKVEDYDKVWTMRNGEHVIVQLPVKAAIRTLGINHHVHHRGQLSVYLRLLNVALPPIYGPSADETF